MKWALFLTVSPVSLFLPLHSLLSSPCVCERVVTDDTESVASCSHCRWQIWKKRGTGREDSLTNNVGHFDREKPWHVRTNGKGHKLWQCSKVPFTELHSPLFNFPVSRQLNCLIKKKKMPCPFICVKVALEAATSKGDRAVYHIHCALMQLG